MFFVPHSKENATIAEFVYVPNHIEDFYIRA